MRYTLDLIRTGLRMPHKVRQGLVARDLLGWLRVEFLGVGGRIGLTALLLAHPRTEEELRARLGVTEPALLRAFLELGASLGELRADHGRWELRRSRARALADPGVDGLAGLVEEAATYDADVYRALEGRLRGDPPGAYLADNAAVVARASRAAEPLLASLVRDLVRTVRPARVLDVGCGSGTYLRHVADAAPEATGAGIDVAAEAVELARANLAAWGHAGRMTIHQADVRDLRSELGGPWDLVLLFQNIYYFPVAERAALLDRLHSLAPHGAVVVATAVAGRGDAFAAHLDLVLQSTAGNFPLPTPDELRTGFASAGFARVDERSLAPRQPLRAFVGWSS